MGVTYSPVSNEKVKKDTVSDVIDAVKGFKAGQKLLLLSPILNNPNRTNEEVFKIIKQQGFSRIYSDEKILRLDQLEKAPSVPFELVVDRIVVRHEEDFYQRSV